MVKLDIHEITATGKRAQICITMPLLLILLRYHRILELIILKSLTYPIKNVDNYSNKKTLIFEFFFLEISFHATVLPRFSDSSLGF